MATQIVAYKTTKKAVAETNNVTATAVSGDKWATDTVILGGLNTPPDADAIVASYPSSTQEVYTYKSGGVSGTTLMTITVTYTTSSKEFISTVVKT